MKPIRTTMIAAVGLVACLLGDVASAREEAPRLQTARSIRSSIDRVGATATVNLLRNSRQSDNLFDHVSRGEPGWIALTSDLLGGSDAGASEELHLALTFALPLNARAVLEVLSVTGATSLVCSMGFIDEIDPAPAGYRRRAIAAVGAVHDVELQSVRTTCLAALAKAR